MRGPALIGLLAAILAIETFTALGVRGLLPLDETRYAAVAWEMWSQGDYLVPHLNGAPYSHKPPLLFWLMHAGWFVFGVNDLWPRLIAPLAAFIGVLLTMRLARRLWPRDEHDTTAALLLIGTLAYALYAQMLLFDLLVLCAALLGLNALRDLHDERKPAGFLGLVLATTSGLLGKGPVILLYLLPPLLLAPWWRERRIGPTAWLALTAGIAVALVWALPAAQAGGEDYARAILWGQTSERLGSDAPHARPWWWYLALLPVMLFPWSLWRTHWQALAGLHRAGVDRGLRFCIGALVPAFITHTLAAGKQAHYLLPMLPLWALIAARGLDRQPAHLTRLRLTGLVCIVLGLLYALLPAGLAAQFDAPRWVRELDPLWGLVLAAPGIALQFMKAKPASLPRYWLPLAVGLFLSIQFGIVRPLWPDYDLREASRRVAAAQEAGRPVAVWGRKYHGEFHFHGRLQQPLALISGEALDDRLERLALRPDAQARALDDALNDYLRRHPDALIVQLGDENDARAMFRQPYRGRWLTLWDSRTLLERLSTTATPR